MNIGKAAKSAGITVDAVRYYERSGLLKPAARTQSGYRQYTAEDVKRLKFIRHAKALGFTLAEIKQLLALKAGGPDCDKARRIAEEKAEDIANKINQLQRMHDALRELAKRCEEEGGDECPILNALEEQNE